MINNPNIIDISKIIEDDAALDKIVLSYNGNTEQFIQDSFWPLQIEFQPKYNSAIYNGYNGSSGSLKTTETMLWENHSLSDYVNAEYYHFKWPYITNDSEKIEFENGAISDYVNECLNTLNIAIDYTSKFLESFQDFCNNINLYMTAYLEYCESYKRYDEIKTLINNINDALSKLDESEISEIYSLKNEKETLLKEAEMHMQKMFAKIRYMQGLNGAINVNLNEIATAENNIKALKDKYLNVSIVDSDVSMNDLNNLKVFGENLAAFDDKIYQLFDGLYSNSNSNISADNCTYYDNTLINRFNINSSDTAPGVVSNLIRSLNIFSYNVSEYLKCENDECREYINFKSTILDKVVIDESIVNNEKAHHRNDIDILNSLVNDYGFSSQRAAQAVVKYNDEHNFTTEKEVQFKAMPQDVQTVFLLDKVINEGFDNNVLYASPGIENSDKTKAYFLSKNFGLPMDVAYQAVEQYNTNNNKETDIEVRFENMSEEDRVNNIDDIMTHDILNGQFLFVNNLPKSDEAKIESIVNKYDISTEYAEQLLNTYYNKHNNK